MIEKWCPCLAPLELFFRGKPRLEALGIELKVSPHPSPLRGRVSGLIFAFNYKDFDAIRSLCFTPDLGQFQARTSALQLSKRSMGKRLFVEVTGSERANELLPVTSWAQGQWLGPLEPEE